MNTELEVQLYINDQDVKPAKLAIRMMVIS